MIYSLLTTDSGILLDKEYIDELLSSGIKAIAFGSKALCGIMPYRYRYIQSPSCGQGDSHGVKG